MKRDENYTLVMWPESQQYMDESWFDEEAILENEGKFGSSAYFIPTKYILNFIIDLISDFENWDGAGNLSEEDITIWVNRYFDV